MKKEETRIEYVKPEVVDLGPAAAAYGGGCFSGNTAPGQECRTGGTAGSFACTVGTNPSTIVIGPRVTP